MTAPSLPTIKRLFAVSRNMCAFDGCTQALVTDDGVVIGRVCHIKAASPGGPRYDPNQPPSERAAFENLLLLCPAHHDVIDKQAKHWSVERLSAVKNSHEGKGAPTELPLVTDRICQQLAHDYAIYEQGVHIGSIHAQTVQIAHGHIYNQSATTKEPVLANADRKILAGVIELFSPSALSFLRGHDFQASFTAGDLQPLNAFSYDRKGPEHEFLSEPLEQKRRDLRDKVRQCLNSFRRTPFRSRACMESTAHNELRISMNKEAGRLMNVLQDGRASPSTSRPRFRR